MSESILCNVLSATRDACGYRSTVHIDESSVGLSCVPVPWGNFSSLSAKHYRGTQCQRLRRISEVDAVHHLDCFFLILPFACDAFVVAKWLRQQRLRWQLNNVTEVPCVLIHASLSPPSVT